MIHQIDECFWIKDAWPVSAHGVGGRIAGSTDCRQNLDSYAIEYTFADGTKAQVTGCGSFRLEIDEVAPSHMISHHAIENVILPELRRAR